MELSNTQKNILISLERGDGWDFGEFWENRDLIKRGWKGGNWVDRAELLYLLNNKLITTAFTGHKTPEIGPEQKWVIYRITQHGRKEISNEKK